MKISIKALTLCLALCLSQHAMAMDEQTRTAINDGITLMALAEESEKMSEDNNSLSIPIKIDRFLAVSSRRAKVSYNTFSPKYARA